MLLLLLLLLLMMMTTIQSIPYTVSSHSDQEFSFYHANNTHSPTSKHTPRQSHHRVGAAVDNKFM